jgi:hypothetical protein
MTRLTTRVLVVLTAGVLVTGCGSGKSAGVAAQATYTDVNQIAQDLGCTGFKHDNGVSGTEDGGICTDSDGDYVVFSLFQTNSTRNNVISLGVTTGGHYVFGDLFLVDCSSAAEMRRVAKLLPGSTTQD